PAICLRLPHPLQRKWPRRDQDAHGRYLRRPARYGRFHKSAQDTNTRSGVPRAEEVETRRRGIAVRYVEFDVAASQLAAMPRFPHLLLLGIAVAIIVRGCRGRATPASLQVQLQARRHPCIAIA